ncbi:protein kinase [bacterium]|nr:protein kinase [bacterium]
MQPPVTPCRCPEPTELQNLLDGRLVETAQMSLEQHLENCPACQQQLEHLAVSESCVCELVKHIDQAGPSSDSAYWPALKELQGSLGETLVPGKNSTPRSGNSRGELSLDFLEGAEDPAYLGRLGHFEVARVVGNGGMGIVLEAYDSHLHRTVAVKVLAPDLADDEVARQRFCREARAAAAITHEHVVAVHQVERTSEAKLPYLVMQFIQGETLEKKLAREGKLPLPTILRIGMQTAAGLAAAHSEGLIHRDVKPGNILLEQTTGRVKLTDFGLARCIEDMKITRTGFVTGTPLYMAPEQALGEEIDERADLFSLGAVLYEMCVGEPPFTGNTPLAVLKQITDTPARSVRAANPEIPAWLSDLIQRLLAKKPDQRPISASVVAEMLADRLSVFEPVSPLQVPAVHTSGACQTAQRQQKRMRMLFLVLGTLLGGALMLAAMLPFLGRMQTQPAVVPSGPAAVATLVGNSGPVWTLAFSPDGQSLMMGIDDGTVKFWNVDSAQLRSTIKVHNGPVWASALSASGKYFATGHGDGKVHIYDTATESLVHSFAADGAVRSVAFAPKGSLLAVGTRSGKVAIWDAERAEKVLEMPGHEGEVVSVAFSPDGLTLGSASGDKTGRLWNIDTGRERARLEGHNGGVYSIAFSSDGKRVATGGWDHTVRLWETSSGSPQGVLQGNESDVWSVAFSPKAPIIAAVGEDRVVRLWNYETLKPLPQRVGHTGTLYTSTFSSRGQLATAGRDGTARIWNVSLEE